MPGPKSHGEKSSWFLVSWCSFPGKRLWPLFQLQYLPALQRRPLRRTHFKTINNDKHGLQNPMLGLYRRNRLIYSLLEAFWKIINLPTVLGGNIFQGCEGKEKIYPLHHVLYLQSTLLLRNQKLPRWLPIINDYSNWDVTCLILLLKMTNTRCLKK